MKKGTIVEIVDNSYNLMLEEGKFEHGVLLSHKGFYEVIQTNILIHSKSYFGDYKKLDIMLKSLESDTFVFTRESFLRVVPTCPHCKKKL